MVETPPISAATEADSSNQDSTLTVLTILWYVYAGLNLLSVCGGFFYIVLGIMALNNPSMFDDGSSTNPPPPGLFGWLFVGLGTFVSILTLVLGVLMLYCATYIKQRRRRTYCIVISVISCLGVPLGTALGVFTIITLNKPQVRRLFDINS